MLIIFLFLLLPWKIFEYRQKLIFYQFHKHLFFDSSVSEKPTLELKNKYSNHEVFTDITYFT